MLRLLGGRKETGKQRGGGERASERASEPLSGTWSHFRKWRRSVRAPTGWCTKPRTRSPERPSLSRKSGWTRECDSCPLPNGGAVRCIGSLLIWTSYADACNGLVVLKVHLSGTEVLELFLLRVLF